MFRRSKEADGRLRVKMTRPKNLNGFCRVLGTEYPNWERCFPMFNGPKVELGLWCWRFNGPDKGIFVWRQVYRDRNLRGSKSTACHKRTVAACIYHTLASSCTHINDAQNPACERRMIWVLGAVIETFVCNSYYLTTALIIWMCGSLFTSMEDLNSHGASVVQSCGCFKDYLDTVHLCNTIQAVWRNPHSQLRMTRVYGLDLCKLVDFLEHIVPTFSRVIVKYNRYQALIISATCYC
jgi:hypothetical protein